MVAYLPVTEGGARIFIHGLVKPTQFCVRLVALCGHETGAFKHRKVVIFKSVIVPILTYGHESWAMTEKVLIQVEAPDIGFLQRLHGVAQGRTKVRWHPGQETSLAPP